MRERQVLFLLCDGATSNQIAFAFGLADDTINQHILSARRKLGVRNRIELVSYALRNGLIPLDEHHHRPGVLKVLRDDDDEIEDLIFRYVSSEGDRELPLTNRAAFNQSVVDWAGGNWREDLSALLVALDESAFDDEQRVPFEGARTTLQETESSDPYEWSGWVETLGDGHYLVVVTTPLPSPAETPEGLPSARADLRSAVGTAEVGLGAGQAEPLPAERAIP